mgnify:CR=1 FL=1
MYRQYEDPYELEKQLKELRRKYSNTKENNADENTLIELSQDIHELEERVNFAWQDDEYECDGE